MQINVIFNDEWVVVLLLIQTRSSLIGIHTRAAAVDFMIMHFLSHFHKRKAWQQQKMILKEASKITHNRVCRLYPKIISVKWISLNFNAQTLSLSFHRIFNEIESTHNNHTPHDRSSLFCNPLTSVTYH